MSNTITSVSTRGRWLLCKNWLTKLNSSLTAWRYVFSDLPQWPTTNVPHVVSTPWYSIMYCGVETTRISCLLAVLYWRRPGGHCDVTSSRRDVSDSDQQWNDSSVVSHSVYDWSSTDTHQIQCSSAMYSCRSSRQTTMSCGSFIPSTLMTLSGLCESVLYRWIDEDWRQTTYMMLSSCVTPHTEPTAYNIAHKHLKFYRSLIFALIKSILHYKVVAWWDKPGQSKTLFQNKIVL